MNLEKTLQGTILDIGGGGEGVIGQLYQAQVTAIDLSQEELEEAPGGFEKVLMDARDLAYPDSRFDNVTFFFSLMYMTEQTQALALREAARVLKSGGSLCIWDCDIPCAFPDPFLVHLELFLPQKQIRTTYGIVKKDSQSRRSISALCREAGLLPLEAESDGQTFYLRFQK